MKRAPYLLCYDIREPKRLRRVHKVACGSAMSAQYSVFYAELTLTEVEQLLAELEAVIDETEDDVRIYAISPLYSAQSIGKPPLAESILATGFCDGVLRRGFATGFCDGVLRRRSQFVRVKFCQVLIFCNLCCNLLKQKTFSGHAV